VGQVGTAMLAVGVGLLGLITVDIDYGWLCLFMLIQGLGIGMTISVR
jgi:hypothetical protein